MKNKQYYRDTQVALDAFADYCVHKACEQCAFVDVRDNVYGCLGRWLNAEVDIVLLPCPHCGGKAGLYIDASGVWVECNECGSETSHGDNAPLAVEIWNMRAQAPALKKEGGSQAPERIKMKNKEYYRETQAAWDAFYEYCAHKACEECAFDKVNKAVYGCFGRWLNEEVDIVLLPCPYCGGEAKLDVVNGEFLVTCKHCAGGTAIVSDAQTAVYLWNKRVQAPALKKEGGPKPVSKGGAR